MSFEICVELVIQILKHRLTALEPTICKNEQRKIRSKYIQASMSNFIYLNFPRSCPTLQTPVMERRNDTTARNVTNASGGKKEWHDST